jgi:hypothetical protein
MATMNDTTQKELLSGTQPVRRSPGGEAYYSLEDSLEILRRCDRMRIAASSPEAFEHRPPVVKVVGILDLSSTLGEDASWDATVARVNSRIRAFVEEYRHSSEEILFTWVVFCSPEDAISL